MKKKTSTTKRKATVGAYCKSLVIMGINPG